ncbi:MAG: hypothetical protein AAB414_02505 [Patescibacteria group bacterium]
MLTTKKSFLLQFASVVILSLLVFYPSFNLALFGDDWLAFWRYAQFLGPKSQGVWNHLTYYLTPYGPQDIIMGILQKVYHFQSTAYYLISYLLRLTAAFSFYPLVLYLTKNKLSGIFAVLFFSVTTIGLDTTNWVFNMPSYITIALLNLFLYFFLKARENRKILLLILSGVLYWAAYVTTPIRMHGSLFFIFFLEVFWILQKRNLSIVKMVALRLSIILVVFLIIRFAGHSQGPPQEPMERFIIGLTADLQMLSQGRFDFIFFPIVMFGSMLIPDIIGPNGQINSLKQILPMLLVTLLIFSLFVFFIMKNIDKFRSKLFGYIFFSLGLWSGLVALIYKGNLNSFNSTNQIFSLLVGGYTLILVSFLIIKFFKEKYISQALFLGASWSILSFFFAWWWQPTSIFPTTYRYLIVSAVGVAILIATIISLGKGRKQQIFLMTFFCLILILHIISTRIYINYSLHSHSQEVSNKIWASIPRINEIGKSREPIIFYFEGDNTNAGILHDVITFGFPPHMALLYRLREEDGGFPVPMSNFKEVVLAVVDGKPMPAYGYPVKPVPIERIYAFHLQNQSTLFNITNTVREKLEELKGF